MTTSTETDPDTSHSLPRAGLAALASWLTVATIVSAAGLVSMERRFLVPIALVGLVILQVVLYRRGGFVRELADATSTRALVLFHVVRAPIGAAFLVAMSHGLDGTFARIAGYGDLVSGLGALAIGLFAWRSRTVVLVWNAVGLLDILAVVLTAQRILIFSDHPHTMAMLVGLPGTLLPTFLVPLVISTHVLLFARRRPGARGGSA